MRYALALAVAVGVAGCSHPLKIRNLDRYEREPALEPLQQVVSVGLVPDAPDRDTRELIGAIGGAMGKHAARVYYPYRVGNGAPVDVIARIKVDPTYEGSGWNFLINFPGFLVWAPAWHGYVYGVNYDIDVKLVRASDGGVISAWKMPVSLDVRHSSMGRTWTEISWLEWGAIALVSGVVFTRYNDSLTPLVVDEVSGPLGDRIAGDIVKRLNADTALWAALRPAPAVAAAPAASAEPVSWAPAAQTQDVSAPAAPPAPAWAPGARAALLPGAMVRTRALADAPPVPGLQTGLTVTLKASVRNMSGHWWYVSGASAAGWVRAEELGPAP